MKVLIIQLARMGDLIQTLPLMIRLRDHLNAHITLMCIKEFSDVLRPVALVNRFIKLNASDACDICFRHDHDKLYELLQHPYLKEPYDLVINLTHDFMSALLSGSVKANLKTGLMRIADPIGYIPDQWGKYLFSVVKNRWANSFNLVDIHIGMGRIPHKPIHRFLAVDEAARLRVENILQYFKADRSPLVGIHLGASRSQRVWPLEFFVRLAELLVARLGIKVVLTGSGAEEIDSARNFIQLYNSRNPGTQSAIIDLTGKTSVLELAALIEKMRLFIACDTGPLHIAAGVGTPTVGLYMATAFPGETAPYGEGHVVITPREKCYPCREPSCDFHCKYDITPEVVFEICEKVFQGSAHKLPEFKKGSNNAVQISVSRFLSNGTLCYIPLNPHRESWFARQVAERFLWDGILGLDHDPYLLVYSNPDVCLNELLFRTSMLKNMQAICEDALQAICSDKISSVDTASIEHQGKLLYLASFMNEKTTSSLKTYLSLYQLLLTNQDFSSNSSDTWLQLKKDVENALAGCRRALRWLNQAYRYA